MTFPFSRAIIGVCIIASIVGCNHKPPVADNPRLTSTTRLQDVSFHSAALSRDASYRVILPAKIAPDTKLSVVYLLHGGGGSFRDWSNYSQIASLADRGVVLVMPQGDDSYYTNSVARKQDRYEDYVINDVTNDVEQRFPISRDAAHRGIVGVSMGGFGAVKLGLKYPERFSFVAGLSSALDVPSRPFSIKRIQQWRYHRSIFGPIDSDTRRNNDPFVLVRTADPNKAPFMFLTCGDQEGLLPANQKFAALLRQRGFRYEFRTVRGGHTWEQWNEQVPSMVESLLQHTQLGR